jgi:hypothetical protein
MQQKTKIAKRKGKEKEEKTQVVDRSCSRSQVRESGKSPFYQQKRDRKRGIVAVMYKPNPSRGELKRFEARGNILEVSGEFIRKDSCSSGCFLHGSHESCWTRGDSGEPPT